MNRPPALDAASAGPSRRWARARWWARGLAWTGLGGVLSLAGLLAIENAALRWLVLPLINATPERLHVEATRIWSIVPGRLHVRGLTLRGQGLGDQWLFTADEASGRVSLADLWRRRFVASGVRAEGVSARYRLRRAPGAPPNPMAPDILDLDPAMSAPAVAEGDRPPRWTVQLDDMQLDVVEVWLEDLRFEGEARAHADVSMGRSVDASVGLVPRTGRLTLGGAPVASEIRGELLLNVASMPRRVSLGRDNLRSLSGEVRLETLFDDLGFLEYYLESAPWLSLLGHGELRCDLKVNSGQFGKGSWMLATTDELTLGLGAYSVAGASQVSAEVTDDALTPTQVVVGFQDFRIADPGGDVMVEGTGFIFSAASADVSLVDPFTSVDLAFDLPTSSIPDARVFDRLLPDGLGLSLIGGDGRIAAHVEGGTAEGATAIGRVVLWGRSIRWRFDQLGMTLDLDATLPLASGSLTDGTYRIDGASIRLRDVRLVDLEGDAPSEPMAPWWATMEVVSGTLQVEDRIAFRADLRLTAANSGPFVRVLSQRKPIAPWIQRVLDVPDVQGSGHLSVSPSRLDLSDFVVTGGPAELRMRWARSHHDDVAQVYARYGMLAAGLEVEDGESHLRLFGARGWYEGGGPQAETGGSEQVPLSPRAVRRIERRSRRSD